ncbi:MAG: 50S ribosomal protein L10 [Eggerthellaceae bacterium]|nr:50S ribosomal protein L10 [Eggerthellaceae bacterium]
MPNAQNVATLEQIKEDLQDVSAMWVVDYRGLTVKQIQALRREVRESGSTMKVYKNTLVRRALADMNLANLDEILEGPSAFIFAGADPVASAKVLKDFAKSSKIMQIKGGMMDGEFVNAAQVEAIASLPSKEQLLGQIAGLISGMARGLAVSIGGVTRGLAVATQAVAEQKSAA